MIDIAHFFVLITDQGHKSQLWKTVEFKLLPYFTAMLTQRLPKVTWARKQDYSTVNLYLHYSIATPCRLNELWLPPIRALGHILLAEPGTEAGYLISCLVSCETLWQSVCQSPLWRLNEVAAIPTAQAAEGWAIVRGQGVLWIYKSVQRLACTKEDYFFLFFFFNDNIYSLVSFKLWRPTHLNVPNVYWKSADLKTSKL